MMTLLEMVRVRMSYSTLPTSFWGYALDTTMYLLNLILSKSAPNSPIELWPRRKSIMRYINIWSYSTYVLKMKSDKLKPKIELCLFIGYPKGTSGGLFYSPEDGKVFVSSNIGF
jgi:hypothetical protein